jgi:EpsI family protein
MNERKQKLSILRCVVASALMLIGIALTSYYNRSEVVPPRMPLQGFPKQIDAWDGKEGFFDKQVYDILGVDDSTLISYQGKDGKYIELYVGYYNSQREGDLIHSPKNCLPGSGWNITQTSLVDLSVSQKDPHQIKVIKLLLEKGSSKQVVLYWFQSRGRYIASEYLQKFFMVWDAITKNRTDEAFVRLISPVGQQGEEYTTDYLKAFAERIIPILSIYLPGADVKT